MERSAASASFGFTQRTIASANAASSSFVFAATPAALASFSAAAAIASLTAIASREITPACTTPCTSAVAIFPEPMKPSFIGAEIVRV